MSRHVMVITVQKPVKVSTECVCFVNVGSELGPLRVQQGGHMPHMIVRQAAAGAAKDAESLVSEIQSTVVSTEVWEETMAMQVTKVITRTGCYYVIVLTDESGPEEAEVFEELEAEIGKKLSQCVVTQKRHFRSHPEFQRSKYFDLIKVVG